MKFAPDHKPLVRFSISLLALLSLCFSSGLSIAQISVTKGEPRVTVDSMCFSWHVCVHDTIGIHSVTLLDDPQGNFDKPPKQFHNVHFDQTLDPTNSSEIVFSGKDTVVCFDVLVSNPLDTGYAPLYIVNIGGSHAAPVPELRSRAANLRLTKMPDFPAKIDTLLFPPVAISDEICSTLVYINTSPVGGKSLTINSASLKKNTGQIKLASTFRGLRATLKPGDTLKVTICFSPNDTIVFSDSLILKTDCFEALLPIIGHGGTPLILATDIIFENAIVGTTSRKPLTIRNVGTLPFVLTKNWILHNSIVFSVSASSAALLPVTLIPGGKAISIEVSYTPRTVGTLDSTTIDWNTDIPEPYTNSVKSYSILKSLPIKPGVYWEKTPEYFIPDSSAGIDSIIRRVHLINNGGAMAHVGKVDIIGQTASEFSIIGDALGKLPLDNFDMHTGDTIWVDVLFKPDLTKPYPDRYFDRIDSLEALYFNPADPSNYDSTIVTLIGTWTKSGVTVTATPKAFTIYPNPASGNSVIVSFVSSPQKNGTLSLYDVLGREVYKKDILQGALEAEIPVRNLSPGIYYVRYLSDLGVLTQKLEIVK